MSRNRKVSLLIIVLIGVIIPFVSALVIIELFFLVIPFTIVFILTLMLLITSLFSKSFNFLTSLFVFSILPIFIFSQLASGFTVDKIQRFRSSQIIKEIENIQAEKGLLPIKYEIRLGIKYVKAKEVEKFDLNYSRGFLVTERYDSGTKKWKSYGWND